MTEHYIFTDEQTAIDAEAWLCAKATELGMGFKQKPEDVTECYAIPQQRATDNKWHFQRISEAVRSSLSNEDINEFLTLFNPSIEAHEESWVEE